MKNTITTLAAITILFLASCTSENDFDKGKRQLEQMGYTDIENTGYDAFCCSKSDNFSTGFKCKDKAGKEVTGCFCSALLKGITVRFN